MLNVDTPRSAVRHLLVTAARYGGAENLRWNIIANEKRTVNKVSYLVNEALPQGWFAYLCPGAEHPRPLGWRE